MRSSNSHSSSRDPKSHSVSPLNYDYSDADHYNDDYDYDDCIDDHVDEYKDDFGAVG